MFITIIYYLYPVALILFFVYLIRKAVSLKTRLQAEQDTQNEIDRDWDTYNTWNA